LLGVLILQFLPLFVLIPSTVYAQQTELINTVKEVNHLEYFLEFSANINNYTSTKYRLDFTTVGSSALRISVNYEDVSLTKGKRNFQYQISLETNEINSVSLNFYELYLIKTHTELFLNLENAGNPQTLRVDETVIFADFLKRGHFEGVRTIDTTFQYVGMAVIEKDLIQSFTTYHYSTNYQWESDGVY
jgi:hypothetical protein